MRGQTPVLQETFNWEHYSLIAGITLLKFLFRFHEGSIRGPQMADCLCHLLRHVPGKLLIVWDGASIHRSQPVKDLLIETKGRLWLEALPAYAPELNPAEYLWAHLKSHEICNLLARNGTELSLHATPALKRMRRRPSIITACWKQAELWP